MKNIKIKKSVFNRYLSLISKKILSFFIRLKFMKSGKVKISVFNRYLILLIVLLFTYLFYLSIPVLYNYERLQKDLTTKLLKEFNLNASLSGNITYKILPAPNFEISNVILATDPKKGFYELAQIKKMKVYVSIPKLHSQKELNINKIVFLETNFNINKKSFKYIINYLKKKNSNKKIEIKKSKVFFRDGNNKKDAIALSSIVRSKIFYDKDNNNNKMKIQGSIFNTNYDLNYIKNIENLNSTNFEFNFKQINIKINNELFKVVNNKNDYKGKLYITFFGSEIKIDYDIKDKLILLSSDKSTINKKYISFNGKINTSPFYYDIDINIESINPIKLINNLAQIKNLLQKNILLNKNFNGKITVNINSLNHIKLFDQAKINLKFMNGKLILDDTILISKKIGKLSFIDSNLIELDNQTFFKAKILFEINDQKRFYQKLQIPKAKMIKLNNIYLELEKNLNENDFFINKLVINSKIKNNSLYKTRDLTNVIDINEIKNVKNWIGLKKLSNEIFSEIN